MKMISVKVGFPREVEWNGRRVTTGIFKVPLRGPIKVRTLNLEGDGQADLSVHGGPTKAVYVYLRVLAGGVTGCGEASEREGRWALYAHSQERLERCLSISEPASASEEIGRPGHVLGCSPPNFACVAIT